MFSAIQTFLNSEKTDSDVGTLFHSPNTLIWIDWRDDAIEVLRPFLDEISHAESSDSSALLDTSENDTHGILVRANQIMRLTHQIQYFIPSFVTDSVALALLTKEEWDKTGDISHEYFIAPGDLPISPFKITADQASQLVQFMRKASPRHALFKMLFPPTWQELSINPLTKFEAIKLYSSIHGCDLQTAKRAVDEHVNKAALT